MLQSVGMKCRECHNAPATTIASAATTAITCVLHAGGGQGIGRAFAHALGEAGAAVAVVDVVRDTAQATAAELAGKGIRSVAVVADITRAKDCERCGAPVMSVKKKIGVEKRKHMREDCAVQRA